MIGDDRPTGPQVVSSPGANQDDPFGALRAGTTVGKYEIGETLGQGGFGITYRARDTQLRRDVAIKEYLPTSFAMRQGGTTVLPRSTHTAEDFRWGRERFLDEARTLATLEDAPGIVNVYDFMEANGTAYMVMALVRGETIEARLKRDRRLPQPAIELLLYPLLDGLERVHEAGFLHRDIKPSNILLDGTGRPTLIDFGASRVALQGRTQALTAVYTPGYAAFEQSTSAKQGPATDIYALAATLYHCVTGAPPPPASDRMIDDCLVPAAEAGKGRYAPSLLAAIDAGLKLKPVERPQTIGDWRRVLSGIGASGGDSLGAATREMDEPGTRRMAEAAGTAPRRRRGSLMWIAAGVMALALAGGGAWVMLRGPPETPEQELQRAEAEAQRQVALATRLRQEEEARQRTAAEAKRKAEEEVARKAAEEKAAAEAAARRQAEEAERQRAAAAEARRKAEAEAAHKAAEEKAAAEAAARRQAEEAERQRAVAAEAKRKTEEEAARKTAEEKAAVEAIARRQAEEEAARRRAEEQARAAAEAQRKSEEEAARKAAEEKVAMEAAARRKAEEEEAARRRAEEQARAEAEARRRAEEDARRAAEEKARTEQAAREKAAAEEQARAEAEAKRKAEEDARRAAEAQAKAEADARRQAEAAETALRLSIDDRKRVQVALSALGHNTQGSDGTFGPRTRQMIAAWQKTQGAPETGYLTAIQLTALRQQAAPAIARFDEEQKKAEEEKRKAEEEARRKQEEEARKRAEEEKRRQQPQTAPAAPPSVAAAKPSTAVASVDGTYYGRHCSGPSPDMVSCVGVVMPVQAGAGTYTWAAVRCKQMASVTVRIDASGAVSGTWSGFDKDCTPSSGPVWGRVTGNKLTVETRGNLRANLEKK